MYGNSFNPRNPLLVADIFYYVLKCLVTSLPQRLSKEECRTLAVLSRTCRAFSEPSLNILWRRLNSLLPLVRCFADVADEDRVKIAPSPLEWLTINRYAPRIRDLTLGDEPLSLHFVQHTGFVLPNLMVFRWKSPLGRGFATSSEFSPNSITFVLPLLTQNLVTVEAQFSHPGDPDYQLFIENYPLLCPNLKSIKIDFVQEIQDHITDPQVLSQAICSNSNWQHVELSPPIKNTILKHLGRCSTLGTVSLALAPLAAGVDEACFGPEDTPFRGVSRLSLMLWDSFDSATCLLRPHDQAFDTFSVTLHAQIIETEASALLRAVASPQRIHSLQSLNIVAPGPLDVSAGDGHHPHLSYETFRPLASLVHLHRLEIDLNYSVSLDDDQFARLVEHWPSLERLRMTWIPEEQATPSMTLKALVLLLASCRRLRMMDLTLDAREIPAAGTYMDVRSPSVIHPIMFRHSPLEHPDLVAKFLQKHMPSVASVYASFARGSTFRKCTSVPIAMVNNTKDCEYQHLWWEVSRQMGHRASRRLLNAA